VVLLAGLADDHAEPLRQAANGVAAEWADREAARLLLDAATLAEIGAQARSAVVWRRLASGRLGVRAGAGGAMRRAWVGSVVGLAMLAAWPLSAGSLGLRDPAGQVHRIAAGTVTTPNWAGYAAAGSVGSFRSVSASWSQPKVTCASGENSDASFWVGLDGYNSRTVEQIGTDSDCVNGVATYFAWYEMYPKRVVLLPVSLTFNDSVTASVVVVNGVFKLSLNGKTVTQVSRKAALSSAEVIAEAPSANHGPFGTVSLADFVAASFNSATVNGSMLASASPDKVIMENGGVIKASPMPLGGDGESFTVNWSHS